MNILKYTLISGASGVLGGEFAAQLAKKGYNLFLTGRSNEKLSSLKDRLKKLNGDIEIIYFACNLACEKERKALFDYILLSNIGIDFLVNVAGVDIQKALCKYTQEKLVLQSRVIFEGTVDLTRFVLTQNFSNLKILTVSSICGIQPMPYFAVYSALKGALVSFFDAVRFEYKDNKSITITTILPSSIPTREDVVADIEKQGLSGRLAKKSPEYTVRTSLRALESRKKNYIPGCYNRLLILFSRFLPKNIKLKLIAKKFSVKEKDAF